MSAKRKTLFTRRLSADRERKNLLFLRLIKTRKSTSRTEISRLTDINIVTVSNYINSYIKKGLVIERGYDVSSGGRRPELLELNRRWGCVAGIEIGDTCIKGVLTGLDMDVLATSTVDIAAECNSGTAPEKAINRESNWSLHIVKTVQELFATSGIQRDELRKIGISVSRDLDAMDSIIREKDVVEREIGIPVLVGNAALCAAYGEKSLNPDAIEATRVLYVYGDLGRGVFIMDNEFYEASDEELRYVYLRPWREGRGVVTEKMIKDANENDRTARDTIKITGINLGVRVAYLANLFEPESIIIGGGIEEAGDLFLDALKLSVNRFVSQRIKDKVKLTTGVLGREACVKGASFLAIREALIEA